MEEKRLETKNEKEADYVARYLAPWNNPRNRVPRKEWQYEHIVTLSDS